MEGIRRVGVAGANFVNDYMTRITNLRSIWMQKNGSMRAVVVRRGNGNTYLFSTRLVYVMLHFSIADCEHVQLNVDLVLTSDRFQDWHWH